MKLRQVFSSKVGRQVLLILVTGIGAAVVLFPIIWMVFASIRPVQETLASPPKWIPHEITTRFYRELLIEGKSRRYLLNGYIVSIGTTAVSLGLGSLAGYGFSRYRIKGGAMMLTALIGLRMLPGVVIIIPFFKLVQMFHLFNTYTGLILAMAARTLPMTIWLLKGYTDSIPRALEEAAMTEGATRIGAFYRVVLPLVAPGLLATGVMAFIGAWNALLLPIVLTSGEKVAPLTVGIALFFGQFGREWGQIMALNTLGVLPLMFVFIFLQRYVVKGMTSGAVK